MILGLQHNYVFQCGILYKSENIFVEVLFKFNITLKI